MATTETTVVVMRCDYCEKPEAEVGFIQSYRMIPTRQYGKHVFATKGARDMDLCAECVALLSRPHVNKNQPEPKVIRCFARRDGVRCMLERGHGSEHLAVDSAHWGWVAA